MEKKASQLIIIVLYKCRLNNSQSFTSLLQCNNELEPADKVVIWDNSPVGLDDNEIQQVKNLTFCKSEYFNTPENLSLSVIYNIVIKENLSYDFVILFDQDTLFKNDFFQKFKQARLVNPTIPLFVPLIKNNIEVVSPGHFYYFKGKYWTSPRYGIVESKNNVVITSGMIIRINAVQEIGFFDERLSLYSIDSNFMIRYSRYYESFYVMDVNFQHDLSDFNEEETDVKLRRFRSFRSAGMINSELFPMRIRLLTGVFFAYKSISNSLKYKDIKFLLP